MLKVGNGRGRLNSVRANLQLMGVAKVPLLCIVGTDDTCEQPRILPLTPRFANLLEQV